VAVVAEGADPVAVEGGGVDGDAEFEGAKGPSMMSQSRSPPRETERSAEPIAGWIGFFLPVPLTVLLAFNLYDDACISPDWSFCNLIS